MKIEHLFSWCFFGACWWLCAFTFGFFQVIMYSLIGTACLGIYIQLTEKKT
jgi:uncharacterized membrane protein